MVPWISTMGFQVTFGASQPADLLVAVLAK